MILFIYFIIVCVYLYMHMYNFLCSDSLLYTSFFFFLLYIVFIHVIVHVYIAYFLHSTPRRLFFSRCFEVRRLFEGGFYSRAAFINLSTIIPIVN